MDYSNASNRRDCIIELIREKGKVTVTELSDFFNVTTETIRRDLNLLDELGQIKKVHGGATSSRYGFELDFQERAKLLSDEKHLIAQKALTLIKPGDSIFVDFGSTTLEFAKQLSQRENIRVITNSHMIANELLQNDTLDVVLLGGRFGRTKLSCVGEFTLQSIKQHFCDYAVIGIGGCTVVDGVMDQDYEEAAIASQMIQNSSQTIILADSSKVQRRASTLVSDWSRVDFLVTVPSEHDSELVNLPNHLVVHFSN